ncbi:MAG: hypothetical protein JW754_04240 [Candidatus Aenigmarchaeota archaeon]|nr:hypothetical protein [Candidatus Aenigmarchaeota archaeon]
MNILEVLPEYEIRRMRSRCNYGNCDKKPSKKLVLFELNRINETSRDLISLFLCTEHYEKTVQDLPDKLKPIKSQGKSIKGRVADIGLVTH